MFLTKAEDLGERLLRAFNSPSGIPFGAVTIGDGGGRPQNGSFSLGDALAIPLPKPEAVPVEKKAVRKCKEGCIGDR